MTVSGRVNVEGRPAGGVDVLAFALRERPTLVATGTTDDTGAFTLPADAPVALLAKLRTGERLGVAVADADDGEVTLTPGPFHEVEIALEGESPERLTIFLDPVAPEGVPEALAPFAKQRAPGVFEGRYAERQAPGGSLRLQLQPGLWRVGGGLYIDGPKSLDPPASYQVDEARDEAGEPLEGSASRGFDLDVHGDRRLTLVVRPLD